MLKRIVLVLVLAVQFAAVAKVGVNNVPWPRCFPCDNVVSPN